MDTSKLLKAMAALMHYLATYSVPVKGNNLCSPKEVRDFIHEVQLLAIVANLEANELAYPESSTDTLEHEEHVQELNNQIADQHKTIKQQEAQIKSLNGTAQGYSQTIRELRTGAAEQIGRLSEDNEKLEGLLTIYCTENARLTSENMRMNESIETLKETIDKESSRRLDIASLLSQYQRESDISTQKILAGDALLSLRDQQI